MPTIYDNIEQHLLDALRVTLQHAEALDCCVGYFNLRGWESLADSVDERFDGSDAHCVRLLAGMYQSPEEELRNAQRAARQAQRLDGPTIARLRLRAAELFNRQLVSGYPTAAGERALQQLARQLRARKVRIKLFLRHRLHAKLYIAHRADPFMPLIPYLGSSNLTMSGLTAQGELNVDVQDQDAAQKLQHWFDERWNDPFAFDISAELAALIETSWAREELVAPYLVYLKMIYHLSEEARQGEREFKLPQAFQGVMLDFQARAVSLAAHHLHARGGVMLGDVVGLGKTLMATAIAKIFQEDEHYNTLILCPPKLVSMWQGYVRQYGLVAEVMSIGKVLDELPRCPVCYRLVIIDESHNLRNREGKRYHAIHDYIERNASRCLLLTATPYNKHFTDIGNQLRLFLDEDRDLGLRPEQFFQQWSAQGYNEADFTARFQTLPRSLRAFEQSEAPDDWRDLMRLFLVRRTRRFIMTNYARYDAERERYYVLLSGQPSYFPLRQPRKLTFALDDADPNDQYAHLYRESAVDVIQDLALPRYGLANYVLPDVARRANAAEKRILDNLSRAGRRLIGFCRTNLFKRLESSGSSFLLSLKRHVLRNVVTLHALENDLPIPIGAQDVAMLDTAISDTDVEWIDVEEMPEDDTTDAAARSIAGDTLETYRARAAQIYQTYRTRYQNRFYWLPARFFRPTLHNDLLTDARALLALVSAAGTWNPAHDAKLDALHHLLTVTHPQEKVLIFTQFADTAHYLAAQLQQRGARDLATATAQAADPTALAQRFSPRSNGYALRPGETELRVLIATDVLAEGQNLQDCAVVVNYDLPWAIVRLIQRAGRVDRIGQQNATLLIYVFEPAEGVERIIRLRARLSQRLQANQEVIGADESFFGEETADKLRDLYTEKIGVLDEDDDQDVDLSSMALQVWNSASAEARRQAERLPPVVYATRPPAAAPNDPAGVLAYLRFPGGVDTLVRVDEQGQLVSQSITAILNAAACAPETPARPRRADHYDLLNEAIGHAVVEATQLGGHLGSLRSASRKVYERLKTYREQLQQQGYSTAELDPAFDALYHFPLTRPARDAFTRQLRLGITDPLLAEMLIDFYKDERLVQITEETSAPEPVIMCSLGLMIE